MQDATLSGFPEMKNMNSLEVEKDVNRSSSSNNFENTVITRTPDHPITEEICEITSMKIIQLSKKVRELTALLNSERMKCAMLVKRLNEKESELKGLHNTPKDIQTHICNQKSEGEVVPKSSVSKYEAQITELRTQVEILKREAKLAKRALEFETGEVIPNLSLWLTRAKLDLNGTNQSSVTRSGGWRGRQQRIISLQNRIRALESLLFKDRLSRMDIPGEWSKENANVSNTFSGASSIGIDMFQQSEVSFGRGSDLPRSEYSYDTRLSNQTSKFDSLKEDNKKLEEELENVKKKLCASRVRLNNTSNELKELKEKVYMMAQKGYNDDKLVDSLVKHNESLRIAAAELKSKVQESETSTEQRENEFFSIIMQNKTESERLKEIISERDSKINELMQKISELNNSLDTMKNSLDEAKLQSSSSRTPNPSNVKEYENMKNAQTEIESLKKLIECLDSRFEQTIEQKLIYEKECSRLKQLLNSKDNQSDSTTKLKRPPTQSKQSRKPTSAQSQDTQPPSSTDHRSQGHLNLDYLLSDQLIDDTLNKAGLGASAAKIVTKRIREFQTVITDLQQQTQLLQNKTDAFHQARRQDVAFLTQIVNEIRSQPGKVNQVEISS